MVEKIPRWNEELNTRAIFTVKSLELKQQCGHFAPLNDSSILYTTANGGGSTDSSGQHQDKPAAPPEIRVIDGRYEHPDDYEELRSQPPRDPSGPKPEPVKYGELTAQQILELHLLYSYAHQQGNTTHKLVGDFLATNTMHFAINSDLNPSTSGLHLIAIPTM
ncbi:MAG: hypothetical protein ACR2PX_12605 [Endozoicomonas sp.]|uniref:hypothetical protein n=1 Tax=Endozoicomonas sp. TaxID=1892382 RepID=UPI003D9B330A